MLVFLSDLHLTDGSSGTTIHRRAVGDILVSDLLNHFPIKIQKYIQLDKNHQLIMQLREIDNVRAPPKYSRLDRGMCRYFPGLEGQVHRFSAKICRGTSLHAQRGTAPHLSGCENPHFFRWR